MNRDYGAWTTHEAPCTSEPVETPEIPDYYVTVCAVCEKPGSVIPVDVGDLLTYAHYTCTPELVDNPRLLR